MAAAQTPKTDKTKQKKTLHFKQHVNLMASSHRRHSTQLNSAAQSN